MIPRILLQLAVLYWEGLLQFYDTILGSLIKFGCVILVIFITICRHYIGKFYYDFEIWY